jgi:acyl transferase domain-containing protein/acyl carrier protein
MDTSDKVDKVAVIGMACRFPGASCVREFWQNLRHGKESMTEFEDNDILASGIDAETVNNPLYVKKGFIVEDEDLFDAAFFGYSPREAEIMDPQHRLFLETAWRAFEDAGYSPEDFSGDVGVFAGSRLSTYLLNLMPSEIIALNLSGFQTLLGNDKDYLTSRVSYKMNLKGPSITVQTACSSSLVAVHMACESLLSGGCDMALAGGVALSVPQKTGYLFQQGMILSQDGHCRAFDAHATGLAPGNGVGAVLLKRLDEAIEDRDNIHAVILGSAVNNDGSFKAGYTAPSVAGQSTVIREALDISGVEKETITYIETHGTGTALGDPVEIEALALAYGAKRGPGDSCAIGSVKTNIGHLDTAAGVASLIKTILSLKNAELPPSLNFASPNPLIDFEKTRFHVNTSLSEWKRSGFPRRAGVSSFGFGGTNAHMVLEEAPERLPVASRSESHLLAISAKSADALREHVQQFCRRLDEDLDSSLSEICLTAGAGRTHFSFRAAVVGKSAEELKVGLNVFSDKEFFKRSSGGAVFVFPGEAGWIPGMGRELFSRFPTFSKEFKSCDSLFEKVCGLSPKENLLACSVQGEELRALVFAVEYSLGSLWHCWGASPDRMMGVGVGEYVAACHAGVFSLEDGIRLLRGAPADGIRFSLPRTRLLSPATGKELDGGTVANPAYWSAPKSDDAALPAMDAFGEDVWAIALGPGIRHFPVKACPGAATGLHAGMDEERHVLENLRDWYLKGFTVDWAAFYRDRPAYRVSIPGYPFRKKRYWFDGGRKNGAGDYAPPRQREWEKNLPFSGCKLDCASPIFQFLVESHACPSIRDHQVHGIAMAPAGVWWEMTLSSGAMLFDGRAVIIRDMTLHSPLMMREGHGLLVQIVFEQKSGGSRSFTAFSPDDAGTEDNRSWNRHMTGNLIPLSQAEDLPEMSLIRCRELSGSPLDVADFRDKLMQTDYVSDHTWNWWRFIEIRAGKQDALSRISFTESFMEEACHFAHHPSLIDPCLQTLLALLLNEHSELANQKAFMPVRFGHVRFFGQSPKEIYCHAAIRHGDPWRDDHFVADLHLFALDGSPVAMVESVEMRNIRLSKTTHNDAYAVQWQAWTLAVERTVGADDGCWLVIGDSEEVSEQLRSLILESGHEAVALPENACCEARESGLLAECFSAWKGRKVGILFLQGTSAPQEDLDPAQTAVAGQIRAVSLLQAIKASRADIACFCVATCGAVAVFPEDLVVLQMAPLWGFCRVAAQEHPDMGIFAVDLGSWRENQAETLRLLWDIVRRQGAESEIALRNNQVFVPRLRRITMPAAVGNGDYQGRLDGTFLITGGLGGVGLKTAVWLAGQGVRHIVLVGRSAPDSTAQKVIDELTASSVHILVRKGDVACRESLAAVLDEIRAVAPPLKAVFHLAGMVEQRFLVEETPENIKEKMTAKTVGAWNLHLLTLDDPLELFVLFSSLSTLMGGPGNGNYAAANIFLDALAHFRNRRSLPALSINWGPFSEVGMLADDMQGHLARMQMGIHSFSPEQALPRLAEHWACSHPQVCIAQVDWDAYVSGLGKNAPPLFSHLVTMSSRDVGQAGDSEGEALRRIMGGPQEHREKLLTQFLTSHVVDLLGLSAEEVSEDADFIQLGMDSLIFLSLSSVLSKELNIRVASHELSQFPTASRLAQHIVGELSTQTENDNSVSDISRYFVLHSDPENRFEPFELTDIQQAYWVGRSGMLGMGRISCHGYSEYDFTDLDQERFQTAWRRLIVRHEMLRAVVLPDGRQKILEEVPDFVIPVYDLTELGKESGERSLAEVRTEMSHQIFASDRWPLFDVRISRLDDVLSRVHMSMDFLLTDAHSMRNLFKELWRYYNDPDASLPVLTLSFRDYVLAERRFRDSPVYQASRQYWMKRLDNLPGAPELPTVKTLEDIDSPVFVRRQA